MTTKQSYYNVLGIKPDASASDVKAAYKSRVKAFYAEEKFLKENNIQIQDILIANEILSDSNKRRKYDKCLGVNALSNDVFAKVSYKDEISAINESNYEEKLKPCKIEMSEDSMPLVKKVNEGSKTSKERVPGRKLKKKKKKNIEIISQPKKVKEPPIKQKTKKDTFNFDSQNENAKNESDFKLDLDKKTDEFNIQAEKYSKSEKDLRKTFLFNKKKRKAKRTILAINRKQLLKQYDEYTKSLDKYLASTIISIENMHTKKIDQKTYAANSKKASQKDDSIDSNLYSKKHYSNVCKELKKREKQKIAEVKRYKKQDDIFKEYIASIGIRKTKKTR